MNYYNYGRAANDGLRHRLEGSVRLLQQDVEAKRGDAIQVRYRGNEAKVLVMNKMNFFKYTAGASFKHLGGQYSRFPVCISVPESGKWYVVVQVEESATATDPSITVI